eukprot:2685956-Amphidinium_carterae.1
MSDVQVQPWFQYEDDVTINVLGACGQRRDEQGVVTIDLNKKSFVEVDKRSLTAEQLQHVVATRW